MRKRKMFLRMLLLSLYRRKNRVLIALMAITIGNLVVAGLLNVYDNLQDNMSKEMRNYGANAILSSADDIKILKEEKVEQVNRLIPKESLLGYAPVIFGEGFIENKEVTLVGLDLAKMITVAPYWKIEGNVNSLSIEQIIIGSRLAELLNIKLGSQVKIKLDGQEELISYQVTGIVSTGGTEDEQIFLNLKEAQKQLDQAGEVNYVLYSIVADADNLSQLSQEINDQKIGAVFSPVKQIAQSEEKILAKLGLLVAFISLLILGSTFLSVMATFIAMVTERKKEIALKKALGAQEKAIAKEFLAESTLIALLGCLLGWSLGWFFAQWIAQEVFDTVVTYQLYTLGLNLVLSLILVFSAAIIPLRRLSEVRPAVVLKGE